MAIDHAFVDAELTYTIRTGTRPVSDTSRGDGRLRVFNGEFESRRVKIHNGRLAQPGFDLDVEGFRLLRHETSVSDFYDPDQLAQIYYPEIDALVKSETGAREVLIFDHTLRHGDEREQSSRGVRETVSTVHNDYTEWSGPQRLRDLVAEPEVTALLERRFAIVQVWRPIHHPALARPLALCDARSVDVADLIPSERRHPGRVGETYQVEYNPAHRWTYFPAMGTDEALVFKVYDSARDGRARFPIHGSFDDPTTPVDAPPRESIEVRTIALFND